MIVVFVLIFGLFIGSFLNVVIYRLHREESFVKGSSKCLFCGHRLYPKDLIPLFSYVFLRGHCRYCQQRFSSQYPLVEATTALAFILIFINIFPQDSWNYAQITDYFKLLSWWTMASFLIIIFVYDLRYYLILDKVILPAIIFSFFANLVLGHNWWQMLLAGVVGGGFFLLQYVLSKGRWIGGGDIRLGALMGIILSWPHVLTALFIAYILGSIISVILLLGSKKAWGDKVPFGTFLSLATFVTLLYHQELTNWYFSLFS
ncbi:prepilin peptidase [Candidatus Parcubacteria bacterium]|nr:MAG: prepilin peptidase [Candidatus Parcubacteria bacterium]